MIVKKFISVVRFGFYVEVSRVLLIEMCNNQIVCFGGTVTMFRTESVRSFHSEPKTLAPALMSLVGEYKCNTYKRTVIIRIS